MFFHILTFTDYSSWVGYGPAVLWTLRAEFWFYVLFPLILMIVRKRHVLKVAVAGILIGIVAKYQIGHTSRGLGNLAALSFTLEYLDNLMLGAVCAILIERKASIVRHFSSRLFLWLPIVLIGWAATDHIIRSRMSGAQNASRIARQGTDIRAGGGIIVNRANLPS